MDLGGRAPRRSEASGKKISGGSGASVEALSSHGMASEVVRRGRDPVWARSSSSIHDRGLGGLTWVRPSGGTCSLFLFFFSVFFLLFCFLLTASICI